MLLAARQPGEELTGLPSLVVGGLCEADASVPPGLGDPGAAGRAVADQILAEARGNPLALLELPRGLTPAQLAGGFGLPGALALSGRIEESFLRRLRDCRRTLSDRCWWPLPSRPAIRRSSGEPPSDWESRRGARAGGVGRPDRGRRRVRFRHPLARSAVYRAATPQEDGECIVRWQRRPTAQVDPDRRAWHLAEAAAGPDEDVAAELERAAGRAQARGGLAAAAAFLERRRADTRALAAHTVRWRRRRRSTKQVRSTTRSLCSPPRSGRRRTVQRAACSCCALRSRSPRGAERRAPTAAGGRARPRVSRPGPRACDLPRGLSAAMFAGRLARGGGVVEISEAASPAPRRLSRPGVRSAPPGVGGPVHGGARGGRPDPKEALRAFRGRLLPPEEARWLWFASWIALFLFDDEAWTVVSRGTSTSSGSAGRSPLCRLSSPIAAGVRVFRGPARGRCI